MRAPGPPPGSVPPDPRRPAAGGPHECAAPIPPRLSAPPCGRTAVAGAAFLHLLAGQPRSRTPATTCGSFSISCGRPCPTPTATCGADANSVQWAADSSFSLDVALVRPCGRRSGGGGPGGRRSAASRVPGAGAGAVSGALAPELLRRLDRAGAGSSRPALRGCRGRSRGPARGAARVRERRRPRPALAATRPARRGGVPPAHAAAGAPRRSGGRAPGVSPVQRQRCSRELGAEPSAETVRTFERIRGAELGPQVPTGGREGNLAASGAGGSASRVGAAAGGLGAGRPWAGRVRARDRRRRHRQVAAGGGAPDLGGAPGSGHGEDALLRRGRPALPRARERMAAQRRPAAPPRPVSTTCGAPRSRGSCPSCCRPAGSAAARAHDGAR